MFCKIHLHLTYKIIELNLQAVTSKEASEDFPDRGCVHVYRVVLESYIVLSNTSILFDISLRLIGHRTKKNILSR